MKFKNSDARLSEMVNVGLAALKSGINTNEKICKIERTEELVVHEKGLLRTT